MKYCRLLQFRVNQTNQVNQANQANQVNQVNDSFILKIFKYNYLKEDINNLIRLIIKVNINRPQ